MSVAVSSSSHSPEAPFSEVFLKDLVQDGPQLAQGLIEHILSSLQKKSSKHKFLVLATTVDAGDGDFLAKSSFGALWDAERDGYISVKRLGGATDALLVTVYWIFLD